MKKNKAAIKSIRQVAIFVVLNIAYNSFMLFFKYMPGIIAILSSLMIYLYNYRFFKKRNNPDLALSKVAILCIPTSFISIVGTSYGEVPISWFSITILLLTIKVAIKRSINNKYLILYLLFCLFYIASTIVYGLSLSSVSQFLTISIFLFSFQIGEYLKKTGNKSNLDRVYVLSTICFAAQLIAQRSIIALFKQSVGYTAVMGANRTAYAGLMNDYSFASLYLATGCFVVFLEYIREKRINTANFLLLISFLLFATIITSARTGLIALAITMAAYIILNINKNKKRILLLLMLAIMAIPLVVNSVLSVRSANTIFDDSGRMDLIKDALVIFKDNKMIGIGFGVQNIANNYSMTVPHNLVIQYLLQFGIIGATIFFINLLLFYKNNKNNYQIWVFIMCIIGAMFIPDIVSSRFIGMVVVIIIANNRIGNKKESLI